MKSPTLALIALAVLSLPGCIMPGCPPQQCSPPAMVRPQFCCPQTAAQYPPQNQMKYDQPQHPFVGVDGRTGLMPHEAYREWITAPQLAPVN